MPCDVCGDLSASARVDFAVVTTMTRVRSTRTKCATSALSNLTSTSQARLRLSDSPRGCCQDRHSHRVSIAGLSMRLERASALPALRVQHAPNWMSGALGLCGPCCHGCVHSQRSVSASYSGRAASPSPSVTAWGRARTLATADLQSAVANAGHAPRKAHHGCLLLTRGAPGSADRASTSRYPLVSFPCCGCHAPNSVLRSHQPARTLPAAHQARSTACRDRESAFFGRAGWRPTPDR